MKTRRLAAIMFTDIVGYTALMQRDENAAALVRSLHREVFQRNHELYNGEIVQYYGDGTLSVFQSGVEAVKCAVAIQNALREGEPVPLRIGLHMGDIVFDGTEIFGDGVNLASRIESLSIEGSILLSGKLNGEIKNHPQVSTISLGQFELKNVAQPIEVFAVTNDGIRVPERSEVGGKQKRQDKSIAVLPFANMSSEEGNEYFSDGITEEIINALAKIKGLKVTSRTSSFFFKGKNLPVPQIGRELNVSTILEGSIRLSGSKVRITAQLIDVSEDFHFWSETFDRSMDDIFAVQDEISLLIADRLREHIGHFDIDEHLVDTPEIPIDIYKRYLEGRFHLLKMTRRDIEKGLSILEAAIEEQPNYPLAYLGIHLGYTLLGTIGLIPAGEAFAKAAPFLKKALELDENLPECQLQLSYISLLQDWDLPATYVHLNKALEIRPTVEYYQSMASTLVAEARYEAAMHYIDTALQLDPFSAINHHLKGFIYYAQEKFVKAIEWFEKSIGMKSDFLTSTLYLGQALLLMGRPGESLIFFRKLPEDESGDILKLGGMTLANAALGNAENAEKGIGKLEAALETELMGRALNLLILCQATMGRVEATLKLIEQGIEFRLPMMIYLQVEPILKPLRSNSRFQELMQKILGDITIVDVSKRKYKKSLFNKELLEQYRDRLELLMSKDKPYLDTGLTLRDLAQSMEIPPNHLSQLLSEGFHKNFAEYVNSYRIEAFKSKAADLAQRHLTILALAYDSGFNSKTVFNTFFKKMEGKTPKAFWKEVTT